jgi:glycosyltransferase involved in cell wall biosynthesis
VTSPAAGNGRVAYLVHRIGPYHRARLNALASDHELTAIELQSKDKIYAWSRVDELAAARATLFQSTSQPSANAVRRAVFEALNRVGPGVVAVPGWATAFALAGLEWCVCRRATAILLSDSTAHDHARRPWLEGLKSRVIRLFTSAHVGGTLHRRYLETLGFPADRVWDGYDVVDTKHFELGARRARDGGDDIRARLHLPPRYFLAVGRFIGKKNFGLLIDAYGRYVEGEGERAWGLVLVGDGPLRGKLEREIGVRRLGARVVLPGFIQYDELPAYFGLAGAFIHPACREPWGLVVNEALAASLPVLVSSRTGCAPDLVRDGENGFVFDPSDAAGLEERMHLVAGDRFLRGSFAAASSRTSQEYGLQRFVRGFRAAASVRSTRESLGAGERLLLRVVASLAAWRREHE